MLGLFGTLNLGARSLATQQQGAEVAGQNLANVSNPAYARQRLEVQTSPAIPTAQGAQGTGVDGVAIVQLRDVLLDRQITSEASVTGSLNAQQSALQNTEANLGEQISSGTTGTQGTSSSTQYGVAEALNDFFNSFQALSTDPGSLTQRQAVLQKAQGLASQLNQLSSRLGTVRSSLNSSIQNDAAKADQDLADIASLNQQIISSQAATGGTANDLIDLRQQKLEDLAGLANFTATAQANGAVDISIAGHPMVSGASKLDTLQAYDAGGGQYLIRGASNNTPLPLTGGSIQGSIDVRDGELAGLQGDANKLASQLITQVNSIYSAGYDLNGTTGQTFFSGSDAGSISVNASLASDPSKLQASGTAGAAGDNTIALALAQLAGTKVSSLGNQTFSQSFAQTVAGLGQAVDTVNHQITTQTAVDKMLTNQRSSVSGVSLDEEMTNLMQFQKAYEASAKLVSTVSDMLTTVIAMKAA